MLIRVADRPPTCWANGGGETRELIVGYLPGETSFSWRISIATIAASGPFSRYEGVDRSLVALDCSGLVLAILDKQVTCDAGQITKFRGEDTVCARIGPTPIRVLNIMTRRIRAAHTESINTLPSARATDVGSYAIALAPCTIGGFRMEIGDLLKDCTQITGPGATENLIFVTITGG